MGKNNNNKMEFIIKETKCCKDVTFKIEYCQKKCYIADNY